MDIIKLWRAIAIATHKDHFHRNKLYLLSFTQSANLVSYYDSLHNLKCKVSVHNIYYNTYTCILGKMVSTKMQETRPITTISISLLTILKQKHACIFSKVVFDFIPI